MGPTRDDLERRLAELKAERDAGQEQLALLGRRETELRGTLQRITGAIEVLEEMLASGTEQNGP